jgi:hypothetical protein
VTLPGTVQKIIPSVDPRQPDKAEVELHDADHLYREIRIDNQLATEDGKPVRLKKGAHVDVTVEADPKDTLPAG